MRVSLRLPEIFSRIIMATEDLAVIMCRQKHLMEAELTMQTLVLRLMVPNHGCKCIYGAGLLNWMAHLIMVLLLMSMVTEYPTGLPVVLLIPVVSAMPNRVEKDGAIGWL